MTELTPRSRRDPVGRRRPVEQHRELLRHRRPAATRARAGPASRPDRTPPPPRPPSTRPSARNTICWRRSAPGSVSVTRGTNGSSPASGTPTTSRDRSASEGWSGNSDARVAVGPDPEQHQVEPRRPGRAQLPLVVLGGRHRARARPSSGARRQPPTPPSGSNSDSLDHPVVRALVVRRRRTARRRTRSCARTRRCRPRGPRRRTLRTPPAASTRPSARSAAAGRDARPASPQHARAGIVDDLDLKRHARQHLPRSVERRPVGGVAQQRLPDPLAEDPALAARRAQHLPAVLAVGRRPLAARAAPLARSSDSAVAVRRRR